MTDTFNEGTTIARIEYDNYVLVQKKNLFKEIFLDGTEHWYYTYDKPTGGFNKQITKITHRDNGPAMILPTGYCLWYKDGKNHREDGPAIIRPIGPHGPEYHEWWLNGEQVSVYDVLPEEEATWWIMTHGS